MIIKIKTENQLSLDLTSLAGQDFIENTDLESFMNNLKEGKPIDNVHMFSTQSQKFKSVNITS